MICGEDWILEKHFPYLKISFFYLPDTSMCVYMYIFKYLSKDILVTFNIQWIIEKHFQHTEHHNICPS